MADIIKNHKTKIFLQWALLVILTGVLAVSLYFFVGNLESLKLHGYMRARFRHQLAAQKITPDQISGWMTFRYINLVFGLPPVYLQNDLNIKNSHYPNLSIDSLAKQQNMTSAQLVFKVSNAVKAFAVPPHT
jgi:hypothetical protein